MLGLIIVFCTPIVTLFITLFITLSMPLSNLSYSPI